MPTGTTGLRSPDLVRLNLTDETAEVHVLSRSDVPVHSFPDPEASVEIDPAARCFSCAGWVVRSHPPGGAVIWMASGGCGAGVKLFTVCWTDASVCASKWAATSSRLRAASLSPWAAAKANHL